MKERILVVDDDKVILELASIVFRSRGYTVTTASDGVEALQLVDEQKPALVLLDYMMPGMDGLEILTEIKRRHPEISVIMFTGQGNEEVAVRLMKAGASDYLIKPFRNHDLLDRVEQVLRMRQVEEQNRELLAEREKLLHEIESWNLDLERRVAEKSRELELAQAEIIQVEKLAALGHLVAGLAHEIRNPLNSINLFAQIVKNGCTHNCENAELLDRIQNEVERIDGILVKLLAASRPTQRPLAPVDLEKLATQAIEQFQPQIAAAGISLETAVEPVPLVTGDTGELMQIFTNLIANAVQAMPQGGALRLSLSSNSDGVKISVGDTGCGIPEEHRQRIFDPFFTTRSNGTGFGLSVVLRIVKTYQGKISLESEVGKGSCFDVLLPLPVAEKDA